MKIEAVTYLVNWRKFKQGYSFFVPCIDSEAARASLDVVTRRLRIKTLTKVVVEEGVKGLRVWRV
jgi:hypothetical protein